MGRRTLEAIRCRLVGTAGLAARSYPCVSECRGGREGPQVAAAGWGETGEEGDLAALVAAGMEETTRSG